MNKLEPLNNFIIQQKQAIEVDKKLQSTMTDELSFFDNYFYFHMNSTINNTYLKELDINTEFTFYAPLIHNDKYRVKAITIANSFSIQDEMTQFSSSNFSINIYDSTLDIKNAFFLHSGQELLKLDENIFNYFLDSLSKKNLDSQKISYGLYEQSLQSYDALNGNFTDFLQDINKNQIQPFFKFWNIPEFKGSNESKVIHISGLQKNFNKLFDTLICSLYAKSSTNLNLLSKEKIEDILAVSDIHEKIKNHYRLDQSLLANSSHNPLKKI